MKKLTCFALASLLLLQHNPASAQTCSAAFTWSLGSNKTVSFYAADSMGLTNRWIFGDGSQQTTTGFAITHAYAQPGQYEVRHYTERPGTGCHDSLVKIITIPADSCSITARFGYWKDTFDCKKIHFINYSAPISANAHFSWKFGDGSTSTDGNPVHAYAQAGKYYVCLVSEAGANCRASYCDSVIVGCGDSCAVQPNFTWRTDSPAVANKIIFSNLSIVSSSAAGVHYTWNFGDSSAPSHDVAPAHVYAHTGIYTVCLVAEAGTCRKEICKQVEIKSTTTCHVNAGFSHYSLSWSPLSIRLEGVSQGDSAQYHWSFGDSTWGDGRLTTHYYAKAGWYTVCLQVTIGQCRASSCQTVFVGDNCDSVFIKYSYTRNSARPNEISFKAVGGKDSSAQAQVWSISKTSLNGTGVPVATLYQQNPRYVFTDTGWYRVCLNMVTAHLCRKEYCETIHIEKVVDGPRVVASVPNPAVNSVTIEVTLDKPETVIIRILDGSGIIKSEFSKTGATGNNRFTLPVERLSRGIYLVEIHTGTRQWFSRFQKG